jgi:hypothetical protein
MKLDRDYFRQRLEEDVDTFEKHFGLLSAFCGGEKAMVDLMFASITDDGGKDKKAAREYIRKEYDPFFIKDLKLHDILMLDINTEESLSYPAIKGKVPFELMDIKHSNKDFGMYIFVCKEVLFETKWNYKIQGIVNLEGGPGCEIKFWLQNTFQQALKAAFADNGRGFSITSVSLPNFFLLMDEKRERLIRKQAGTDIPWSYWTGTYPDGKTDEVFYFSGEGFPSVEREDTPHGVSPMFTVKVMEH